MGSTSLSAALERINGGLKERSEGLEDLKHILRHIQRSPQQDLLNDAGFHQIYESLFRISVAEQQSYARQTGKTTRAAAENRLSRCSGALRLSIEIGVRSLRKKTVLAVLDHLVDSLRLPTGQFCQPLAIDYAKSLRSILAYLPHIEHLLEEEWNRIALFCVDCLKTTRLDDEDEEALSANPDTVPDGSHNKLSYRSTKSFHRENGGSQGARSQIKQVVEEIAISLRLLVSSPNAPLKTQARTIAWALIDFLRSTTASARSHQEVFTAMNNILLWTTTEDTALTHQLANSLIRLVRNFWVTRNLALREQLLVVLIRLKPYILSALRKDGGVTLRTELGSLLEVLRTEYGRRQEKDLLSSDDLRLVLHCAGENVLSSVHTSTFSLRPIGSRAEQNWSLLHSIAFLIKVLRPDDVKSVPSDAGSDVLDSEEQPRKRPRLTLVPHDQLEELISATTHGSHTSRTAALQTMAFLVQVPGLGQSALGHCVGSFSKGVSDENPAVSSWSMIALAGCAWRHKVGSKDLQDRWAGIWQQACRALNNSSLCRAACLLLEVLIRVRVASRANILELLQTVTTSIDIGGPTVLADSVLRLLTLLCSQAVNVNPASSLATSESILSWLYRCYTPRRLDDRAYAGAAGAFEAQDLVNLVSICLNQSCDAPVEPRLPIWESVAQSLLHQKEHDGLISYLLLLPSTNDDESTDSDLISEFSALASLGTHSRAVCETLTLNHFNSEMQIVLDLWTASTKDRAKVSTSETMSFVCMATVIAASVAWGLRFEDTKRAGQLQQKVRSLVASITAFVSVAHCEQEKFDVMLHYFAQTFSGLHQSISIHTHAAHPASLLAVACADSNSSRRETQESLGFVDDDDMDIGDAYESQESRQAQRHSITDDLDDEISVAFSKQSFRVNICLKAFLVKRLWQRSSMANSSEVDVGAEFVDHALSMPIANLLASRRTISALSDIGIDLTYAEAERLLDYLTESVLRTYHFQRSEVALGTIVDVMASLSPLWTSKSDDKLYGLGLDTYEWYMNVALKAGVLSPNVQKRFASLLLQLAQSDTDYGSDSDAPSVRTSLFQLVERGGIQLQYHLSQHISVIFGLFVLSAHDAMFDDLQASLPARKDWSEGIAMRLLFLSNLAAAWPSLLRQCVYYIFETAGQVQSSLHHAERCFSELATSLHFRSSQKLFKLFAPQLLHTWLEDQDLTNLPYAAFQYDSLEQLLSDNCEEVAAQVITRGQDDGLATLAQAIGQSAEDVLRSTFAKTAAYAICWDVSMHASSPDTSPTERRMREILGSKEQWKPLFKRCFPAIVGHFFLSLNAEDASDQWLEKSNTFSPSLNHLMEMRAYSQSTRVLPPLQQPFFKVKFLPSQMERLCRRVGLNAATPWDPSALLLAIRMLLDTVDEALGSLHTCIVVRKLRLLIAMAGDIALQGYCLQTLITSLRAFLSDSQCADDVLGVLKYLFQHGQEYLQARPTYLYGTVMLVVLQMQQHSGSRQASTTQESQHRATVKKMHEFQAWLTSYARQGLKASRSEGWEAYDTQINALDHIRLPGNARIDTPESRLLLLLLEQYASSRPALSIADCSEALAILTRDFDAPDLVSQDCLGSDESCIQYMQGLCESLHQQNLGDDFVHWAGKAIGRAFAAKGARIATISKRDLSAEDTAGDSEGSARWSQIKIVKILVSYLNSCNRYHASVAEYTLRCIGEASPTSQRHNNPTSALEKLLSDEVHSAISGGEHGYRPNAESGPLGRTSTRSTQTIKHALTLDSSHTFEEWCVQFALMLCARKPSKPIVSSLSLMAANIPGCAAQLISPVVHILLDQELSSKGNLRGELSAAIQDQFLSDKPASPDKQQFFVDLLLYLRSRDYPEGSTKADNLRWLDVDWATAARVAEKVGMPAAALLFAESSVPQIQSGRRSTSRVSQLHFSTVQIESDLLMSIYRQIEEPDSFYGVQQPASVDSVLDRLAYEGEGYRSLMFRSARMDGMMIASHNSMAANDTGMVRALAAMNMNSITLALMRSGFDATSTEHSKMFDAARKLQQWDIAVPSRTSGQEAGLFAILQSLSQCSEPSTVTRKLQTEISLHLRTGFTAGTKIRPSASWLSTLSALTEIEDVLRGLTSNELSEYWHRMSDRQVWMQTGSYEDFQLITSNRATLFGVLSENQALQEACRVSGKELTLLQAKALLLSSDLACMHGKPQDALTSATHIMGLADRCRELGMTIDGASKLRLASVLAELGEVAASANMLKTITEMTDLDTQSIPVGRSGLLARLGHQLEEARLEKPDDISSKYLETAIVQLKDNKSGKEAGDVFFQFASFCDRQLQNPSNTAEFQRISKVRQSLKEEVAEFDRIAEKKLRMEGHAGKNERKARKWFEIDDAEYQRQKKSRDTWTEQSLLNYMLALQASDAHDICVLRFFALWLENDESIQANAIVAKHLQTLPSWKFVVLLNQLMSRLKQENSKFQQSLSALATRICSDHPYHSFYHLFAMTRSIANKRDEAAHARRTAGMIIRKHIENDASRGDLLTRTFNAAREYQQLAFAKFEGRKTSKIGLKELPEAYSVAKKVPSFRVPPPTINVPLAADGNYNNVPVVHRFEPTVSLMGGLSAPKTLTAIGSDGQQYKQLFKGGDDDLRQDAIMEQVFGEVSKILQNHKATRQRSLHVRTYKVIPLTNASGIIEFVKNSVSINEVFHDLHYRYHPQDMSNETARSKIGNVAKHSQETRVKEFRKVCEHIHPILRHFFFERFNDPEDWFAKRTAYTRTTAAISILGHVLGLGDRHCQNIMLDTQSGEVVHIDLGIAFEAGRVLPIPELVPFRLTRDIIDGMGITGTEGVFRRCCEFTLDALREDKDSIMTLLNVLRYDPLYSWTVSPIRAKRMQDAQTNAGGIDVDGEGPGSNRKKEQQAGEADRALSVVEKKLGKTLSTAATVNELIQQATDIRNLATLFQGWSAYY